MGFFGDPDQPLEVGKRSQIKKNKKVEVEKGKWGNRLPPPGPPRVPPSDTDLEKEEEEEMAATVGRKPQSLRDS